MSIDKDARIEELEAAVADLRQHLFDLPERFRKSFYARSDHRYSGIKILTWLEDQVKTILAPTPTELRSELLARQGRMSNALAGVLAVWDRPTEQGLQDAMQTLVGAMDDFQKADEWLQARDGLIGKRAQTFQKVLEQIADQVPSATRVDIFQVWVVRLDEVQELQGVARKALSDAGLR